jgi:hypothetical protein
MVVLAVTWVACAGDGDDGGTASASNAAVRGCEAFAQTWCGRAIGCLVELGTLTASDRAVNEDVCIDVGVASAQCERAVALGPTYDQCLEDIDAMPCSHWNVPMSQLGTVMPPSTCAQQVLVRAP